ncbi:MAG: zf-HC2 domain-containing protein [Actinomycetota bacterium]|nr:zf-HC2 domain-containing protein [Actinomycetota bacterium]
MATGHAEVRGALAAYAIGALEEPETARVEDHLASCPECRDEVRQLQEVTTSALGPDGDAPDGLWSRVSEAIRDRRGQDGGEGDVTATTG